MSIIPALLTIFLATRHSRRRSGYFSSREMEREKARKIIAHYQRKYKESKYAEKSSIREE